MFAQPFDHSFNDLFNQYVNMESSSVDGNKDVSFTGGDLDQFFSLDSLSSDCGDISPSGSTSKRSRRSSQPWGQDLWGVPQDTAASSSSEQGSFSGSQDTIQPSAVSDLSFAVDASSASSQPAATQGLLSSAAPSTPPHTPRKKACTGSGITTPTSNRHPRDTNARRNQLRKQSFSPSLMRASQTPKSRMAFSDASAQRFHSFSFRSSEDHLPLSPPPSDILVQQENNLAATDSSNHHQNNSRSAEHFTGNSGDMSHHYDSSVFNQSPAISMPSPSANALARQQQKYMNQQNNNSSSSNSNPGMTSSPPSADEIFSPPQSSASQSLSSWYSDSLGASSFSFPSDFSSGPDAQAWWSPMGSRVPTQRQQAYQQQPQQPVIASPAPQRPIQSHPEHQSDMFQGGLMIQFDQSFDMSGSADTSFASSSAPAATTAATHDTTTTSSSMPAYSQMATTPQKFINPTFTTPQMPHSQSSQSSPSVSPKTPGGHSRSPRNKFSATPSHPRTPASAITKTPNTRHSYEGKMSMSSTTMPKPTRTPGSSGSMKGSNKSLSVSFVNFTPSDSKKILTGVAPSGSSKTKARREQEARDRRRKLSEAAMMAIRNAGGDIDSLEAILC